MIGFSVSPVGLDKVLMQSNFQSIMYIYRRRSASRHKVGFTWKLSDDRYPLKQPPINVTAQFPTNYQIDMSGNMLV